MVQTLKNYETGLPLTTQVWHRIFNICIRAISVTKPRQTVVGLSFVRLSVQLTVLRITRSGARCARIIKCTTYLLYLISHVLDGGTPGSMILFQFTRGLLSVLSRVLPKTRCIGSGSRYALIVVAFAFGWPLVHRRSAGQRGQKKGSYQFIIATSHQRNLVWGIQVKRRRQRCSTVGTQCLRLTCRMYAFFRRLLVLATSHNCRAGSKAPLPGRLCNDISWHDQRQDCRRENAGRENFILFRLYPSRLWNTFVRRN